MSATVVDVSRAICDTMHLEEIYVDRWLTTSHTFKFSGLVMVTAYTAESRLHLIDVATLVVVSRFSANSTYLSHTQCSINYAM